MSTACAVSRQAKKKTSRQEARLQVGSLLFPALQFPLAFFPAWALSLSHSLIYIDPLSQTPKENRLLGSSNQLEVSSHMSSSMNLFACCPKMWRGRVTCAPRDEGNPRYNSVSIGIKHGKEATTRNYVAHDNNSWGQQFASIVTPTQAALGCCCPKTQVTQPPLPYTLTCGVKSTSYPLHACVF